MKITYILFKSSNRLKILTEHTSIHEHQTSPKHTIVNFRMYLNLRHNPSKTVSTPGIFQCSSFLSSLARPSLA